MREINQLQQSWYEYYPNNSLAYCHHEYQFSLLFVLQKVSLSPNKSESLIYPSCVLPTCLEHVYTVTHPSFFFISLEMSLTSTVTLPAFDLDIALVTPWYQQNWPGTSVNRDFKKSLSISKIFFFFLWMGSNAHLFREMKQRLANLQNSSLNREMCFSKV